MLELMMGLTRYRKQVINNNYKNTLKGKLSQFDDSSFYKKNIKHLSRILIETIVSPSQRQMNRIHFSNLDFLTNEVHLNNGLILLASHFGNWELACVHLPRFTDVPCYGVYKPLKNTSIDEFVKEKRSVHGLHLVPMKKIARIIAQHRKDKANAIYILIADQNPSSINNVIWTDFLGVNTAYNNGPQKLHQKYKMGLAYLHVSVGKLPFEYQISIKEITSVDPTGSNVISEYSAMLEHQIRKNPEYWLWSHKRWKRTFS